jgi:Chaperone of endosialidase
MRFLATLLLIIFHLQVWGQDPTTDRWIDNGDETLISLPASITGRVSIQKDNLNNSNVLSELLRVGVSYAPTDFIGFRNGTTTNGFNPVLMAYNQSLSRGSTLTMAGVTNYDGDTGTWPMMLFDVRKHTDNTITTGGTAITTRPLFAWRNYTTVYMQMLANGNLGLGTTSPQAQLHTTSTVRLEGLPVGAGSGFIMSDVSGNLSRYSLPTNTTLASLSNSVGANILPKLDGSGVLLNSQLTDNGSSVGIGGAPVPGAKLALYGTLRMMSDERAKTNITRLSGAIAKVSHLNGYLYNWRNQATQREVGFLAQEVEQVLPEAVSQNADGIKFLNYDGVIPLLTEAIKEQQQLINQQSELIRQLQHEVRALKKK